ncbi:response regulator transcription factor [Atopobium deltae]|uniref:Putative response regulator protein GraR n=1 Tax=Atopobium deltae TaxID=1393034 RepID=A0A133XPY2_9ACTN|nr:response regulator transcription factor [Atopobium deltae]KXB33007.1 putative response regulator protein GraR [Atopobium deltae]
MAHLFVVEDDNTMCDQLCCLLRNAGHSVEIPTSFEKIAQQVMSAQPDILLLDLGLPGVDGQFALHEIRQQTTIPVIVLTSRDNELDELMSMNLGADDFLAKPYNGQILLARIDAVLRRSKPAHEMSRIISWAGLSCDVLRCCVYKDDSLDAAQTKSVELTKNELRILELLMNRRGAVVSREEIMEALWDSNEFIDDNTLTVNMNRLRHTLSKLGAGGCIVTHRGMGYAMKPAPTASTSSTKQA